MMSLEKEKHGLINVIKLWKWTNSELKTCKIFSK